MKILNIALRYYVIITERIILQLYMERPHNYVSKDIFGLTNILPIEKCTYFLDTLYVHAYYSQCTAKMKLI